MKQTLLIALLTAGAASLKAQSPAVISYNDINNIRAGALTHGDLWHQFDSSSNVFSSGCFYPNGTGKIIAAAGALWIGGYDGQGQLHLAAQTYRQAGNDYWPGPLDNSGNAITAAQSLDWEKIWKVNAADISAFLAQPVHTIANTPTVILEWPAKGNTHARGYNNAALTITESLAPFIDVNADGIYDALAGDYPLMKGHQMLWWVFNDDGPTHDESAAPPMHIQFNATAYGYSNNSAIDNVLYYEFQLKNKSTASYDSMRISMFADADLGYPFDDLAGYDSSHRMGIVYNGQPTDAVYGTEIPAMGISVLNVPGDVDDGFYALGAISSYNNDNTENGNPQNATEYYNLMNGRNRAGNALPAGYFASLSLDSANNHGCDSAAISGDRRFVLSAHTISLAAGDTAAYTFALIVAPNQGGCPDLNLADLNTTADTARQVFDHPLEPASTAVSAVLNERSPLRIYPNPTFGILTVEATSALSSGNIVITTIPGERVDLPVSKTAAGWSIATSSLAPGVYMLTAQSGAVRKSMLFVKQ